MCGCLTKKKHNDLFNIGANLRSVIMAIYYCLTTWYASVKNMLLCVLERHLCPAWKGTLGELPTGQRQPSGATNLHNYEMSSSYDTENFYGSNWPSLLAVTQQEKFVWSLRTVLYLQPGQSDLPVLTNANNLPFEAAHFIHTNKQAKVEVKVQHFGWFKLRNNLLLFVRFMKFVFT